MATRKPRVKKSFQPVDFDAKWGVDRGETIVPPEPPKKTFDEVVATVKREVELVEIGLSKNCAMAIQVNHKNNPFCRVLEQVKDPITGNQAQELIRLALQEFGNKFAGFVKDELRNLF